MSDHLGKALREEIQAREHELVAKYDSEKADHEATKRRLEEAEAHEREWKGFYEEQRLKKECAEHDYDRALADGAAYREFAQACMTRLDGAATIGVTISDLVDEWIKLNEQHHPGDALLHELEGLRADVASCKRTADIQCGLIEEWRIRAEQAGTKLAALQPLLDAVNRLPKGGEPWIGLKVALKEAGWTQDEADALVALLRAAGDGK